MIRWRYRHISSEDKAGIYITAIAHLAVIIILLAVQVHTVLRSTNAFLLDFSAQEAEEERLRETELQERISEKLDRMLGDIPVDRLAPQNDGHIRNIAVDAGKHLKDDRNTDVEKLYSDAERLARELKSGAFSTKAEDYEDYASPSPVPEKEDGAAASATYTGPSVVSYSLDGRKAMTLSIPAYRCLGGGDVTVRITVEQSGTVSDAEIMEEFSSGDRCLREYAKRAARLSRFTASSTAPKRQVGEIVYRFIAQH